MSSSATVFFNPDNILAKLARAVELQRFNGVPYSRYVDQLVDLSREICGEFSTVEKGQLVQGDVINGLVAKKIALFTLIKNHPDENQFKSDWKAGLYPELEYLLTLGSEKTDDFDVTRLCDFGKWAALTPAQALISDFNSYARNVSDCNPGDFVCANMLLVRLEKLLRQVASAKEESLDTRVILTESLLKEALIPMLKDTVGTAWGYLMVSAGAKLNFSLVVILMLQVLNAFTCYGQRAGFNLDHCEILDEVKPELRLCLATHPVLYDKVSRAWPSSNAISNSNTPLFVDKISASSSDKAMWVTMFGQNGLGEPRPETFILSGDVPAEYSPST
jgi:hypothetical protein